MTITFLRNFKLLFKGAFATLLIAMSTLWMASSLVSVASAQSNPVAACLPAAAMKAAQLYGVWNVQFTNPPTGMPDHATMLLQRHAEFSESLAGLVSRDFGSVVGSETVAGHAAKAALAGDLDEGMLLLDESSDNVSITGTWNGEMVPGSCGTRYQGLWKDTSSSAMPDAAGVPFTLTRLP